MSVVRTTAPCRSAIPRPYGGRYGLPAVYSAHNQPYGVDNEEQGEPIGVCAGPRGGRRAVWPRLQHAG